MAATSSLIDRSPGIVGRINTAGNKLMELYNKTGNPQYLEAAKAQYLKANEFQIKVDDQNSFVTQEVSNSPSVAEGAGSGNYNPHSPSFTTGQDYQNMLDGQNAGAHGKNAAALSVPGAMSGAANKLPDNGLASTVSNRDKVGYGLFGNDVYKDETAGEYMNKEFFGKDTTAGVSDLSFDQWKETHPGGTTDDYKNLVSTENANKTDWGMSGWGGVGLGLANLGLAVGSYNQNKKVADKQLQGMQQQYDSNAEEIAQRKAYRDATKSAFASR